jgi:hypothetical protein
MHFTTTINVRVYTGFYNYSARSRVTCILMAEFGLHAISVQASTLLKKYGSKGM